MWANGANAQETDPTDRARALFSEGIALTEQQSWEQAAAKFREAMMLHDAPAVRYNLASALFEMDRLTEPWRLVQSVKADPEVTAELRAHAETLEAQIRDRAAMVTVRVEGDARGTTVSMDGEAMSEPELGREIAVSPERHVFVANRDGQEVARQEIEVARREVSTVTLTVAPPPSLAAAPVEEEPIATDAPSEPVDWRIWAAVGAGVVLLAAVVIAVAVTSGTEDPVGGNFQPGVLRW